MSSRHIAIITAALLLTAATMAAAGYGYHGHHGSTMPSWDMAKIDTNADGQLTFDEYMAPTAEKMRAGYDMIDANADGVIATSEWQEFLKVHGVKAE